MDDKQLADIQEKYMRLRNHIKAIEFYDGLDITGNEGEDLLESLEIVLFGKVLDVDWREV